MNPKLLAAYYIQNSIPSRTREIAGIIWSVTCWDFLSMPKEDYWLMKAQYLVDQVLEEEGEI